MDQAFMKLLDDEFRAYHQAYLNVENRLNYDGM